MNEERKNPIPAVDIVIEENSRILLVRRKYEPFKDHLEPPGGFVDEREKVEDAAIREVREETSLDIELVDILGVYSDPKRDPRGHTVSTVFIAKVIRNNNSELKAVAKDDAAEIKWLSIDSVDDEKLGFDHRHILSDYKRWKKFGGTFWSSKSKL
jgi:ADP-ribose pyrophosphatase YjhB (NUDIX family)